MNPLIWLGAAVAATTAAILAFRRPSLPALEGRGVDALEMLNFRPFQLTQGKETAMLVLVPANVGQGTFIANLAATGITEGERKVVLVRQNVLIPGPTIVQTFANVWGVTGKYTGPTLTVTPELLAQRATKAVGATSIPANRQLAALLLMAAQSPVDLGAEGAAFWYPIAANQ